MSKRIKRFLKRQGFTLVELIIVIAIVAVLAVAAFMMLTKWLGKSRDSRKLGDIETVSKSLQVWLVDLENTGGLLPLPDDDGDIMFDGINIFTQGKFGTGCVKVVDSMQKLPMNPVNKTYTYSRTIDGRKYQISTELEDGSKATALYNVASAGERVNAVRGNFEQGIYTFTGMTEGGYIALYLPSITTAVAISGGQADITENQPFVFDGKGENLVDSIDNLKPYNEIFGLEKDLDILWTGTKSQLGSKEFVDKITESLSGMVEKEVYKEDIISMMLVGGVENNTEGEILYSNCSLDGKTIAHGESLDSYESKNVTFGGTCDTISRTCTDGVLSPGYDYSSCSVAAPGECDLDGDTIAHGDNIDAYSENSITWNASYECSERMQNRTCNNGSLDGDESYQYASCIKGTPLNCEAKSYEYMTGHTYDMPQINHEATDSDTISIGENNGTFDYTLTVECSNGSYTNEVETKVVTGCDIGYYEDNNACLPYTYAWVLGDRGSCSVSCGGGTKTRSVTCQRNDGQLMDDSYCTESKPATSTSCNTASCCVSNVGASCRRSSSTMSFPQGGSQCGNSGFYCSTNNQTLKSCSYDSGYDRVQCRLRGTIKCNGSCG